MLVINGFIWSFHLLHSKKYRKDHRYPKLSVIYVYWWHHAIRYAHNAMYVLNLFNGASAGHPLKCEGTWVSSLHREPNLWNSGEGRWGQKDIQNPKKKKLENILFSAYFMFSFNFALSVTKKIAIWHKNENESRA